MNSEDWEYLLSIATVRTYQKENIVFYQGDEPVFLHILIEGAVKICKYNTNGNEIILREISQTSMIAQLANLEEIAFPSSCMAMRESRILLVDYARFKARFFTDPQFMLLFIKSLTQRVVELESLLSTHLTLDAKAKIAKFIYENGELINQKSKNEISKILNITPETFSRNLKKLKEEKIIQSDPHGNIHIVDRAKLEECFL